jgi:hypothetical protein
MRYLKTVKVQRMKTKIVKTANRNGLCEREMTRGLLKLAVLVVFGSMTPTRVATSNWRM